GRSAGRRGGLGSRGPDARRAFQGDGAGRLLEVFFFQAEDGIRDFHVTGVQTCTSDLNLKTASTDWPISGLRNSSSRSNAAPGMRSEERRVGKEGRTRWSPEE